MNSFERHLEELFACRACPGVAGTPVCGAAPRARVLLLGQAPGPREQEERRPFAYTAGKRLFQWFDSIGASEQQVRRSVHIAAVIRCFPGRSPQGGDRVPSPAEIERCGAHLDREIRMLEPRLVLCVGTLAAQQILGESALAKVVGPVHRAERAGKRFDAIVLPHPSGRSTWLNRPEHKAMLERALVAIREHPAWLSSRA